MGRRPTGSTRQIASGWEARIRITPKWRRAFHLATCGPADGEKAEQRTKLLAGLAYQMRMADQLDHAESLLERAASVDGNALDNVIGAVKRLCEGFEDLVPLVEDESDAPTFQELATEWTEGKLHKRFPDHVKAKKTADSDEQRLGKWVYPIVGDVRIDAFTLDHAEKVMAGLGEGLKPASRRQIAQLLSKVLNMAAYPCRYISVSPIPRGWLPKAPKPKPKAYLYPVEERQLLGHTDIPVAVRLAYGILAREGMRKTELLSLTWGDVDLKRGTLTLDENKSDEPRAWVMDAGVTAALRIWREMKGKPKAKERILGVDELRASDLRAHLLAAKVKRKQIHVATKNRDRYNVHAHRGTFVTLALAAGRTEAWVTDRTGHTTSLMLRRYKRAARNATELDLGWLAPLDEAIPELADWDSNGTRPPSGGAVSGRLGSASPQDPETTEVRSALGSSVLWMWRFESSLVHCEACLIRRGS